jgi:hypothetical protein
VRQASRNDCLNEVDGKRPSLRLDAPQLNAPRLIAGSSFMGRRQLRSFFAAAASESLVAAWENGLAQRVRPVRHPQSANASSWTFCQLNAGRSDVTGTDTVCLARCLLPLGNGTKFGQCATAKFAKQMLHMPCVVHSSTPFAADAFQMAKANDEFQFKCLR